MKRFLKLDLVYCINALLTHQTHFIITVNCAALNIRLNFTYQPEPNLCWLLDKLVVVIINEARAVRFVSLFSVWLSSSNCLFLFSSYGGNERFFSGPETCWPKQDHTTLQLLLNNRTSCCQHGLRLPNSLWGCRWSEGGLSLPAVPQRPSVVLPAPRALRGGALGRWWSNSRTAQK